MPYRVGGKRGARMVNMASRPFYQVADRILGSQFLEDIAEFFLLFQTMYAGFVERANAVTHLLHDRRTTFVVVTTLESAPLREAEFFVDALREDKLHIGAMVLNKVLPSYLLDPAAARVAERLCSDAPEIAAALPPAAGDRTAVGRVLTEIGESFLNFAVVAEPIHPPKKLMSRSTDPDESRTLPSAMAVAVGYQRGCDIESTCAHTLFVAS